MRDAPYSLMKMRAGNVIAIRTEAPAFCVVRYSEEETQNAADRIVARLWQKAACIQ